MAVRITSAVTRPPPGFVKTFGSATWSRMSLDLFRSSAMTAPRSFVDSAKGTFLFSWMFAIRSRSVSIGRTSRAFERSLTGPSSGVER